MYWWARQYPVSDCKDEARIAEHTAINMYQWLREVWGTHFLQDPPIVLGGSGVIVEIDESLFQHKPKVFFLYNPARLQFENLRLFLFM